MLRSRVSIYSYFQLGISPIRKLRKSPNIIMHTTDVLYDEAPSEEYSRLSTTSHFDKERNEQLRNSQSTCGTWHRVCCWLILISIWCRPSENRQHGRRVEVQPLNLEIDYADYSRLKCPLSLFAVLFRHHAWFSFIELSPENLKEHFMDCNWLLHAAW